MSNISTTPASCVFRLVSFRIWLVVILLTSTWIQPLPATGITIDGKEYSVDTLANFKVGPGSRYTSLRLLSNNRLDVYFLKVDATNPYVTFRAALGRDSIYTGEPPSAVAKRKSKEGAVYFAGTNGDFYATTGYIGYPVAGCVVDYEIARPPSTARKVIAFEDNKIPFIGAMWYEGKITRGNESWSVTTVNHLRETNQLVLYNQHNGKVTRTNSFGTEVLVELLPEQSWKINSPVRVKVIKTEQGKGNMTIPKGAAVLSGHGTSATLLNSLAVNEELEIQLTIDNEGSKGAFSQLVGGDNRNVMLKDGVIETAQIWNELHPRTAIGYSQDQKTVIFCVVDGRGASAGVTTKQLAELMKSAGAWTAFNMDGGGSSAMYVKEFGPMNATSDGTERAVANSIFAVSSAPTDPVISSIESYETTIKLPKFGVFKPRFLGYNQYGMLINKDVNDVVLSCDATAGYINANGEFVFTGSSSGKLTATLGNISTTVTVQPVHDAEIFIRLDSVCVDLHNPYPIEVQSKIGLNTMTVLPSALTWTIRNPDVCEIKEGIVTGLNNGTTIVVGSLGTFRDSIKVTVEIPSSGRIVHNTFSSGIQWALTSSLTSWNTHFDSTLRPQSWEHGNAIQYTFQSTRSPFFKLTGSVQLYGLPDTIQIVLNTGTATFNSIIVGMKSAVSLTTTPVTFNNVGGSSDFLLSIPRSAFLTNTSDFANFPLSLEYLTFYLNSSGHVSGQTYVVGLKEIALRYKHLTTRIPVVTLSNRFHIYPNPAKGSLLRINGKSDGLVTLQLSTIDGRILYRSHMNGPEAEVPIGHLVAGIYLVHISTEVYSETHRFIKQ